MIRRNFVGVVRRGAGCWEWRWDVCCVRLLEEQGQGRDNEMTDDVEMLSLPVTACQFPHKPFANVDLTRPAPRVPWPCHSSPAPILLGASYHRRHRVAPLAQVAVFAEAGPPACLTLRVVESAVQRLTTVWDPKIVTQLFIKIAL